MTTTPNTCPRCKREVPPARRSKSRGAPCLDCEALRVKEAAWSRLPVAVLQEQVARDEARLRVKKEYLNRREAKARKG